MTPLNPEILDQHVGIVAKTGAGKTHTAKGFVEWLLEHGRRVCVIDPTGVWWGLRSAADGKAAGLPIVVFGGEHGDVAVSGHHGGAIADLMATTETSAVIDVRQMTVGERTRFFTDFAETLIRKNKGPLQLVIDEAHLFAPQGGAKGGGMTPAMLHAANNLVSLGRGIGLRIILISQRPAKLHKDSLTQVETLIAMRLIAPQDRNAVKDWIGEWAGAGQGKDVLESLPSLPTGTGWVWAPELGILQKVKFPKIATLDTSKAPTGRRSRAPVLAQIDLPGIRQMLESVAADAVANDPARLKKRVAELEAELRQKANGGNHGASHEDLEAARQQGFAEGVRHVAGKLGQAHRALGAITGYALRVQEDATAAFEAVKAACDLSDAPKPRTPVATPQPRAKPVPVATPAPAPVDGVTGPQQKVLNAIAWWNSAGVPQPSKLQVAFIAGYSPTSSTYSNILGSLRSAGLVDYPGPSLVWLTDHGSVTAQNMKTPITMSMLHDAVLEQLQPALRKVLEPVLAAYPDDLAHETLATAAGLSPTSSTFSNYRGKLRSLGLIDYPRPGCSKAAAFLFQVGGT